MKQHDGKEERNKKFNKALETQDWDTALMLAINDSEYAQVYRKQAWDPACADQRPELLATAVMYEKSQITRDFTKARTDLGVEKRAHEATKQENRELRKTIQLIRQITHLKDTEND